MKRIILGTAGHIDHGKTSLVKAMTGINTDRLKEEQERGITIELGFADIILPGGQHLGIVDVPGHEKFVKNMVAGASGIDIVALIIAADEGVMPQTREHMEICSLLGIKNGFVALTKIDMVDEEWLELVTEDVSDFISGTFLDEKPILPVSSSTGQGISELLNVLEDMCEIAEEKGNRGLFRLPVDRVFTMKGFGTVITGTLISGSVSVGDTIMIYPSGISAKVRGLQAHNQTVTTSEAGMRTALNFQGIDKSSVNRGDVISMPGALTPSYMLDVNLSYLSSNKKPAKNRTRVRFHTGTTEIMGVLVLLDSEELMPGETKVVQIRLDEPVVTVRDDHFVIRSYSPVHTIGGGVIINPIPKKHKRFRKDILEKLDGIVDKPPKEIVANHIDASGYEGLNFSNLKIMTNLPEKTLSDLLQELMSKKTIIQIDKESRSYIHESAFNALKNEILENLKSYHGKNPLKAGMSKEELKSKLPPTVDVKRFNTVLGELGKENLIIQEDKMVRSADHSVNLGGDRAEIRDTILKIYKEAGLTPPSFKDLVKSENLNPQNAKDIIHVLIDEQRLIKTKDDLFFDTDVLEILKQQIIDHIRNKGEISTPDFKDMTGLSRKYVIPLLEYFDAINLTIRIGDARKLRKS